MKQKKLKNGLINPNNNLLELQRNFARIIRTPLNVDDSMLHNPITDQIITKSKKLTPHQHLELYAQQYWWRIKQAFDEDFTSLQSILSTDEYKSLRDEYLTKYPSISYTLRNLGSRLYKFILIKKNLPKSTKKLYLDCILYDWARIEAYDAKETNNISLESINQNNFHKMKIFLANHVKILTLDFPIHKLTKQTNRHLEISSNTNKPIKKPSNNKKVSLRKSFTKLIIFRYNEKVKFKLLTNEEFSLLSNFKKGLSISVAIQKVQNKPVSKRIGHLFQEWNALGLLTLGRQ